MGATDARHRPSVGFLTVLEHPQHGLFGGYLLLNTAGRPLEFHCTAPIKPNRAQEILYGPTLQAFLYGEQIGQTLLAQCKREPLLVCTDRLPMLTVREAVSVPVALVLPPETPAVEPAVADASTVGDSRSIRVDARHAGPRLHVFQAGGHRLAVPERNADDGRLIVERLGELGEGFDLAEPFGRIRAAIEEAQQAVG
jgi:hypothetical protein